MKKLKNKTCTTCPYCGVGCGVQVEQCGEEITVVGDAEHPANFGKLCAKGHALNETLGYENRLLGPKINGQEVSWPAALDRISNEFRSVIDTYGPEAIGFYVSGQLLTEDYYAVNKFVKGYLGTANIDTNSRLCMASSVAGHKRAFGSDTVPGCYEDLDAADTIVLVGSNLAWCHPVLFQRIERARENNPNFSLVVIDPRKTATAEMADLHLPILPGGENDAALFTGLLAHLIETDAVNYNWVAQYTNHFDDVCDSSQAWSPLRVSERTGLSIEQVSEFFRLFVKREKVVTVYSQGVNQSICGTDTVNSIINVHLATGRIGKVGCGPFSITGQPNAMGGREVGGLANMLACHMDIENPTHQSLTQRYWKSPAIAKRPGLKAVDLFNAVCRGRIKALWVIATNPADSMPNANDVALSIAECPFVVVSDISSETDTGSLATVQLPAQAWSEKDGTVTNSERRISRQRAFRTAPTDARPDWWAICEVAKRLGFDEGFNYRKPVDLFTEHAGLSGFENNGTRSFDIGACASMTDEEYDDLEPFQWPNRVNVVEDSARLFGDGKFSTVDQRARFVAVEIKSKRAEKRALEIGPWVQEAPLKLFLNTGRIRDHWHTMTRTGYISKLSSHYGEPFVEINPEDAMALGIQAATLVDVTSDVDCVTVRALLSSRVERGSAFIPMHWTNVFASRARVNSLVAAKTDPVSGQPALKHQQVEITPSQYLCYGFLIMRGRPKNLGFLDYWAMAPIEEGWKVEFGSSKPAEVVIEKIRARSEITWPGSNVVSYDNNAQQNFNECWFKGDELLQAVYVSTSPVCVPRSMAAQFLNEKFESVADRMGVLSGAGRPDVPDAGAIVCSCMSVGQFAIEGCIADGARTVEQVGDACKAGTQCGTCRSEIKVILASVPTHCC